MVLLAAAICTKAGKAIVSRQFVEMTRSRVEGLLAAFPKLMNTGKQHTFVETESVRYVYQPLEKLYMLLITTKASNILEDLETLRLFSRVIPEYCKAMEESEVVENSFQLIFAFDEIVALGYRENVNLAQIRTFTEMDSHEERVHIAVIQTQEREAREAMKRKAKELQAAKIAAGKGKGPKAGGMMGIGPKSMPETSAVVNESSFVEVQPPKPSYPKRPGGSGKALILGRKNKDVDSFVDKLISEGTDVITSSRGPGTNKPAITTSAPTSPVHLKMDEKISLKIGRDGGIQKMEVRGMALLRISDAAFGQIVIAFENNDDKGIQIQTNPFVNKNLFQQEAIVALKQAGKSFPINNDIGILRWLHQTSDDSFIPLSINCWPSENDGQCDVNIEYELMDDELELSDVVITIPVPHGVGTPVVSEVDGEYNYEHKRSILDWQLPVIDASNKNGSMEFSIAGHPDDFFPITVSFTSKTPYCKLKVTDIKTSENEQPVKYSTETVFTVDHYEIV